MTNFEIKVIISENLVPKIKDLGAIYHGKMHQIDYYLKTGTTKEKVRRIDDKKIERIIYHRNEKKGQKKSVYEVKKISQVEMDDLLSHQNVLCEVDKERDLWIYKHTRIHLDKVKGLGNFLELETVIKDISADKGREEFQEIITLLNIDDKESVPYSYSDLIMNNQIFLSRINHNHCLATI